MRITLKLYGNLKNFSPQKQESAYIAVAEGATIASVLAQLGIPEQRVWMCAVNDAVVESNAILREGDGLEVFEPVGGG